jgi:hypothetical protein
MMTAKRALLAMSTLLLAVVYVWFAAVRSVREVKRRKAEARARRRHVAQSQNGAR